MAWEEFKCFLFHKKVNIDCLHQTDLTIFTIKKKNSLQLKRDREPQDLNRLC